MTTTPSDGATTGDRPRASSTTRVLSGLEAEERVPPRRTPGRIGPYRILRQLGRGGMGSVYLAEPAASCPVPMGRTVAIKVLHRADPEERRRFEREAAYLQSLRHPGIVRVLDAGEHDGAPFLVMQLIDGKRLDDLVLKQPLPEREAAEITIQALEALHVAHLAGILHRDIKPGNIMIDRGRTVKLLDFGLASHMHHETRLTRTGNVVGTPAYMSPEQASGDRDAVSRRSDIYSMGACLYELLTAAQPYVADNSVAMLRRIVDEPLLPPSRLNRAVSRDLETVVMVAMAKDPRDRYPSAEAMAADLRRFLAGQRVRAHRPRWVTLAARATWRHRRIIAGAGLAVFLLLSATSLALVHALRDRHLAAPAPEHVPDAWTTEQRIEPPLDAPSSGVTVETGGTVRQGMSLVSLHAVQGQARLSATVQALGPEGEVDLYLNDRDVGKGYCLRLSFSPDGDRMQLLRGDLVVASLPLGQIHRGAPGWRISLERKDDTISAQFAHEAPLRWTDLVPIDSSINAAKTNILFTTGSCQVRQVWLERPLHQLQVSALAVANAHFDDEKYHEAWEAYQGLIHDQPHSPLVPEARLRAALCLEQDNNFEGALHAFLDLAHDPTLDHAHVLSATFHAWRCALQQSNYDQADRLFSVIRQDGDVDYLLHLIPEQSLHDLLQDYLNRAQASADVDPERAITLYRSASELGVFLHAGAQANQGRENAGDLLVGLGRLDDALQRYREAFRDPDTPGHQRMIALLKIAEVERLQDQLERSQADYEEVVAHADGDTVQLARLYLGDVLLERHDRQQAIATWSRSSEATSLAGAIMARLVAGSGEMPTTGDRYFLNDVAYFAARLAQMQGHEDAWRDGLQAVVKIGPSYDWPTPLAKHLLARLPAAPATTSSTTAPTTVVSPAAPVPPSAAPPASGPTPAASASSPALSPPPAPDHQGASAPLHGSGG